MFYKEKVDPCYIKSSIKTYQLAYYKQKFISLFTLESRIIGGVGIIKGGGGGGGVGHCNNY